MSNNSAIMNGGLSVRAMMYYGAVIAICTAISVFLVTKSELVMKDLVNTRIDAAMHEQELIRQELRDVRKDIKDTNNLIRTLIMEMRDK